MHSIDDDDSGVAAPRRTTFRPEFRRPRMARHDGDSMHARHGQSVSIPILTAFFIFGAIFSIAHDTISSGPLTTVIWAIAIIAFSGLMALFHEDRFDLFSPLSVTNIVFVIYFGVGMLNSLSGGNDMFSGQVQEVADFFPEVGQATFWGALCVNIGYLAVRRGLARKPLVVTRMEIDPKLAKTLWAIMFAIGGLPLMTLVTSRLFLQVNQDIQHAIFFGIVGFFVPFIYLSLAISLFYTFTKGRFSVAWLGLAAASVIAIFAYAVPTGSKFNWLFPVVILAFSYNYSARLISRTRAIAGVLLFLFLFSLIVPINIYYREALIADDPDGQQEYGQALSYLADSIFHITQSADDDITDSITRDYMRQRLNNAFIIAKILEYQNDGGLLKEGESYARFLVAFVPRLLWPEKPNITIGQEINAEILEGDEDDPTSVGVTLVGEAVYNFGPAATFFVLFLIGVILGLTYHVFLATYAVAPTTAFLLHFSIWFNFYYPIQESNFAPGAAGAIKFSIAMLILATIFGVKAKHRAIPRSAAE